MAQWSPFIITGDYDDRQAEANRLGCVCYYEQHMNAYTLAAPEYGLVQVAHNASDTSKSWATDLATRWQVTTGRPTRLRQTAAGARGNHNIEHTAMPACLGEPGPITHDAFDTWMEDASNRERLARDIADSIMAKFPEGGRVGLSIGHKGKSSSPHDTGAGDSDPTGAPNDQTEAWYNEDIILRVARLLEAGGGVTPAPTPTPIPTPVPQPKPKPTPSFPAWPGIAFKARMNKRGAFVDSIVYGEALKPWQRCMAARGWNIGRDDGVFGPKCYKVCRAFQAEKGLTVDGVVGRNTWAAAWTKPVT